MTLPGAPGFCHARPGSTPRHPASPYVHGPCPSNHLVSSEHPCPYLAQCFRMYPSPACITPSAAVGYGWITRATTSSPTPACIASVISLIMSPALAATTVAPTMAPVPCLQWISTNPPSWLCGNQWQPVAMSGNQWQSVAISGSRRTCPSRMTRWPSVAISGNQWQSLDLPFEDDSIVMLQRRHIGVNGDAARRRLGLRQPDSGQLRLGVATPRHIRHEPGHLPRVGQSVAISGSQWRSVGISGNQARAPRAGAPATCRQRARSGRRALPSRQRRA